MVRYELLASTTGRCEGFDTGWQQNVEVTYQNKDDQIVGKTSSELMHLHLMFNKTLELKEMNWYLSGHVSVDKFKLQRRWLVMHLTGKESSIMLTDWSFTSQKNWPLWIELTLPWTYQPKSLRLITENIVVW